MNVVIIEDEMLTAQMLVTLIKTYDPSIRVVKVLSSVEDSISWFKEKADSGFIDLIFMDIHLEDGDSFQVIKQARVTTPIIFTTAFDEYMIKAFKVNSIDYLLKPINYDDLAAAIEKFKSLRSAMVPAADPNMSSLRLDELLATIEKTSRESYKDRFMVTLGTKIRTVKTSDIAYFFLEEKVVSLCTFDKAILPVDYSLDKLMQLLDPKEFFRINRQFIVSVHSINLVHTYSAGKLKLELNPKPRQEVFVSGDRVTDFKGWLGK